LALGSGLGCDPGIHIGEDFFEWNHLHGAGVDFVQTALDLVAPGSFEFCFCGAVAGRVEQFLREPTAVGLGEAIGGFEQVLGGHRHGEIVVRNLRWRLRQGFVGRLASVP